MAVYTQLTNEQIAAVVEEQYDLGRLRFAVGITQGVENTNYLVATADPSGMEKKYILTLYEKRMKPQELPFFIELMHHLAAKAIACPRPITRRDGTLYGEVAGRPAAVVSFVDGKSRAQISNIHAGAVGGALVDLHLAVRDFDGMRTNALSLEGWKTLHGKLRGKLDGIKDGLEALIAEEFDYLENHWPRDGLPQGVIHADLFPDNVLFTDDAVSGVIDFYFACNDALAYDVAITLNAWCFESGGEFNPLKSKLLLANYQKKRVLTEAEIMAFPTLLRGAALRFFLTRAYDWIHREPGAQVNPKDPMEYAAKLRFHRLVKSVSEYGLGA